MRPYSLSTRLLWSHVLVAVLTCLVITVLLFGYITLAITDTTYEYIGMNDALPWLFSRPELVDPDIEPSFVLVVAPDGSISYTQGDMPCEMGDLLTDCAPDLAALPDGTVSIGDEIRVVQPMVTGQRLISQRRTVSVADLLPGIIVPALVMTALSVPLALLLARLASGSLSARLSAITRAARQFATGDTLARLNDPRSDDVGQLAQQFNSMADVLVKSFDDLRELARQQAESVQQAERAAVQAERLRLSRDLHDSISQQLFSLSLRLDALAGQETFEPTQSHLHLQQCAALAGQTLADLRTLLVDLRPSATIERSFPDAMRALCENWSQEQRIPLDYNAALSGHYLPAGVQDTAYRVTQEALANVANHAGASGVTVSLLESGRKLMVSISDDGRGFAPDDANEVGHFGLMTMRERARLVGGELVIESNRGRGTTVRLTIPLNGERGTNNG